MPRPPQLSGAADAIRGSVFSALAHRIEEAVGEVYPLHVGDTWLEPPPAARLETLRGGDIPGLHRYAEPAGLPSLRDRLVERTRRRTGVAIERSNLFVTAGATAGLAAALHAMLDPGEEVLILAPYWPLIAGIVQSSRGIPVPVPIHDAEGSEDVVARLERSAGERTAALYLSSPNNPTGRVLPTAWIEAMVEWAARRDLWVISDEVYEDHVFRGEHTPVLPLAPDRTVVAHSFSKAYGMAGHRCGWLVGPEPVILAAQKMGTHSFYSTPTASQHAALRVLTAGDDWLDDARARYRSAGDLAAEILGVEAPDGGTFLFLDVSDALDQSGLLGFLGECADHNLFLAPGPSFGPYETWVRLCFTAVEPARTERGARRLRALVADRVARLAGEPTGAEA